MPVLLLLADGASSAGDEEVLDWGQEKSGKTPLKLGKVHNYASPANTFYCTQYVIVPLRLSQ